LARCCLASRYDDRDIGDTKHIDDGDVHGIVDAYGFDY
jgi:hypothetical protein